MFLPCTYYAIDNYIYSEPGLYYAYYWTNKINEHNGLIENPKEARGVVFSHYQNKILDSTTANKFRYLGCNVRGVVDF
jgi:hypothetical protein